MDDKKKINLRNILEHCENLQNEFFLNPKFFKQKKLSRKLYNKAILFYVKNLDKSDITFENIINIKQKRDFNIHFQYQEKDKDYFFLKQDTFSNLNNTEDSAQLNYIVYRSENIKKQFVFLRDEIKLFIYPFKYKLFNLRVEVNLFEQDKLVKNLLMIYDKEKNKITSISKFRNTCVVNALEVKNYIIIFKNKKINLKFS